jgi:hypothetical protein
VCHKSSLSVHDAHTHVSAGVGVTNTTLVCGLIAFVATLLLLLPGSWFSGNFGLHHRAWYLSFSPTRDGREPVTLPKKFILDSSQYIKF